MGSILRRARRAIRPPDALSSPNGANGPCVVHLVHASNGLAPFVAFLEAWRRFPPGTDCDLLLAMKAFASEEDAAPYLEHARDLSPDILFFADEGLDLNIYFAAAARLRRDRYCFLNSYSEPLVEGWLAKLDAALAQPRVGMVGATGSWASARSWAAYLLRLPSAYEGLMPGRRAARRAFIAIDMERTGETPQSLSERSPSESFKVKLEAVSGTLQQLLAFEPFPAYHLRTNAFMLSHATLARLRLHAVRSKMDAYVLENGRASITRQVQRLGLRTLVVDRAGALYDEHEWDRSHTLWQGAQEGLLVADNQTRSYAAADWERRRLLSAFAWGPAAEPRAARGGAPVS